MYIYFLFKYLEFFTSFNSFCFFYFRVRINFITFSFYFNLIFSVILNVILSYYFIVIIKIYIHIARSIFFKINNIIENNDNLDIINLKIFKILIKESFNFF